MHQVHVVPVRSRGCSFFILTYCYHQRRRTKNTLEEEHFGASRKEKVAQLIPNLGGLSATMSGPQRPLLSEWQGGESDSNLYANAPSMSDSSTNSSDVNLQDKRKRYDGCCNCKLFLFLFFLLFLWTSGQKIPHNTTHSCYYAGAPCTDRSLKARSKCWISVLLSLLILMTHTFFAIGQVTPLYEIAADVKVHYIYTVHY